jgi:hypothetical protein
MITATLDTNILRDALEQERDGHEVARRLLVLQASGKCDLRITTRVDADIPPGQLRDDIQRIEVLHRPRLGAPFRIGYSAVGSPDSLASDDDAHLGDELMALLFPGADPERRKHRARVADVDHLIAHKRSSRDVFVTRDGGVLGKAEVLKARHGIIVMASTEFLASFQ